MIESPTTYGLRQVADAVDPVDASPYVDVLDRRFGIRAATFEPYLVHRPNRQTVWIVRRDLRLPTRPEPHTLGIPFFYADMRWPRPTTATAIRWGALARKNRVEVGDREIARLLDRDVLSLDSRRVTEVEGTGYVLLLHHGATLGVGFYRAHRAGSDAETATDDGAAGILRSMLPRSWTTQFGVEAPPVEPVDWREVEQPTIG